MRFARFAIALSSCSCNRAAAVAMDASEICMLRMTFQCHCGGVAATGCNVTAQDAPVAYALHTNWPCGQPMLMGQLFPFGRLAFLNNVCGLC